MTGKMGVFGVLGFAVAAGTLSGCIVDSGHCGPADVSFQWSISTPGRAGVSCGDVGATTVVIIMGGASTEFPCTYYAGTTDPLPSPGTYLTSFQLLDAARNVIANTDPKEVTVGSCGAQLGNISFQVCPASTVSLTWRIVKDATGSQLSCDQAAASSVRLTMGAMRTAFACMGGSATTDIDPGTYPTFVELLGAGDQPLSRTPSMSITVPACGGVTLPDIVFGTP